MNCITSAFVWQEKVKGVRLIDPPPFNPFVT